MSVPLDIMCRILPTRLLLKHTPDIFMHHLSIINWTFPPSSSLVCASMSKYARACQSTKVSVCVSRGGGRLVMEACIMHHQSFSCYLCVSAMQHIPPTVALPALIFACCWGLLVGSENIFFICITLLVLFLFLFFFIFYQRWVQTMTVGEKHSFQLWVAA